MLSVDRRLRGGGPGILNGGCRGDTLHSARPALPGPGRSAVGEPTSGALLRGWRKRALLTQEQLAERAGLNVRTVRRLESGGLRQPRTTSVLLLAQALELDGEERALLAAVARGVTADDGNGERAGEGPPRAAAIVPRQLPADVTALVGRARELAILEGDGAGTSTMDGLAGTSTMDGLAGTAGVGRTATVDGMAGVGKTALAVHAAHRLAHRFPDGQLFVDLRAHSPGAAPVEPGEALARMLRALGVPGDRIPCHLDDRTALYRSVLAERRVLVVLDDAADDHQVHPLLPAGPGCRVIVTSRRRLTCLGESLSLDVPPVAEAVALFIRTAGVGRAADAPLDVLREVVERCGRLPLAVCVAGARLRAHATWSARHLLGLLAADRLGELRAGRHDVAAALDLSYAGLAPEERRAYRMLDCFGAVFEVHEAAASLGTTSARAARLLEGLLDVHLLREIAPGRYRPHDLVRDHAARTSSASAAAAGR
ncbi:helix-turn-helix domain-containing protein [Nonomuraea sp. PA05]|uniref:ATP-binding protein n=1 Tax=Nonomuraea sp. PA05 TaxID=2604466 RepID=UPI0011DBE724|nr:helix-turn-helix domain-containing protein [Nonomuraea sp. PA05]TYB55368.1 helix-turn-helix domain-containing protein [Nonomuraea sp. PA05]